ncbi:glycosyltransferase [Helicobacter kayseriensis]|uniref:glycosyltransferase n=1 Tax=Helicobacter kayseriensis TaxID=2905877 RepID=UPI001E426474|nr:hypothetical protein [Helicobacter kayseriensis]MCE3048476.1 hypothetical protein [Helicobacter kayseriensis]
MGNQIVQSFWYSKNKDKNFISVIEIACVASYIANHHTFHLYTYSLDDASMLFLQKVITDCPNAHLFCLKDAREIVDEDKIFFDDRGSVGIAAFSDYFRFKLLYEKGGWWVDMDTICLKPLDLQAPFAFASQRNEGGGWGATTCMLKAPPKSDFFAQILKEAQKMIQAHSKWQIILPRFSPFTLRGVLANCFIESLPLFIQTFLFGKKNGSNRVSWGIIGPSFLHHLILKNPEYSAYVCPPSCFCEIDWFYAKEFIQEIDEERLKESYVCHVWNAMWEGWNLPKDARYPEKSLIEKLKTQYVPQTFLQKLKRWEGEIDTSLREIPLPKATLPLKLARLIKRKLF